MQKSVSLDKIKVGNEGIILSVGGEGAIRRRLLDMGLTPGTKILVRKIAPLGDPIEIFLRSYELTLRQEDAKKIQICRNMEDYKNLKAASATDCHNQR